MKKKVSIVGAGISGLSLARMLNDEFDVEVLERSDKAGGLIKCDRVNGNLFHKVGGHVFNSKNKNVLDWFWQHFNKDAEFLQASRNAKILLDNTFIDYPLEDHLYQLPENITRDIISELLNTPDKNREPEEFNNFEDFLIGNFGKTLYNLYFGPYNSKVWNTDISKVPLEWLEGKLPMPHIKEIILNNILQKEESSMVHATFYYPKNNGSQFIIDRLAQGITIKLSYIISTIELDKKRLYINNESASDFIAYCGDVRALSSIIKIEDDELNDALKSVETLISNGTSNVLCETDDNKVSWLYLPEKKYKAHRIIYTGNFSTSNNAANKRKTCVVEFSGKQDKEDMLAELKNLPGNLKPVAFNYEPNSYIIQDKETRNKINILKQRLSKYNIFLLGRFAEWEYYNMDKCIEAAMLLSKKLHAA